MDWKFKEERVAIVSVRSPVLYLLPLCCGATCTIYSPIQPSRCLWVLNDRGDWVRESRRGSWGEGKTLWEKSLNCPQVVAVRVSPRSLLRWGGRDTVPPLVKCRVRIVVASLWIPNLFLHSVAMLSCYRGKQILKKEIYGSKVTCRLDFGKSENSSP